MMTLYFCIFLY